MKTINIITLVPLLKNAIDRHGEELASVAESLDPAMMAWNAIDVAQHGHACIDGDESKWEREYVAGRFEEAALMFLTAAKMLRDEVRK